MSGAWRMVIRLGGPGYKPGGRSYKRQAKGEAMEIKHPSYYKKLRQKRKAASDQLNAENSERFVKAPSHKRQAISVKRQAERQATSVERVPNCCV